MSIGACKAGRALALLLLLSLTAAGELIAQEDLPFSSSGSGILPLGVSDSYLWAGHSIGDGLGYRSSFSNLGGFIPLSSDGTSQTFFEPRVLVTNHGQFGANAGLGYRCLLPDDNLLFGLSGWYDRDNGHVFEYDQLGVSAELLGDNWDLRSNGYFPLGQRSRLIFEDVTLGAGPTFVGRNIFLGAVDRELEATLAGCDLELGRNIRAIPGLRIYGGYYYYQSGELEAAHGARFRTSYQLNAALGANFVLTNDHVFGTNAVFSLTLRWPLRNAPVAAAYFSEERINIPTERHDRIVARRERTHEEIFAQDRQTQERIDVVHVDASAPPGGDGSVERPVATLRDARFAATNGSIIFVRSGTYTDSILLTSGQRLLGDGFGTHVVSSVQGSFLLPGQSVGALPVIAPANEDFVVALRPGAIATEVAGFNIVNSSPTALAAIAGVANGSFYIHDNIVSAPSGYGIAILNSDGNGSWSNGSAPDHRAGIFNNTVTNSGIGGIIVAHSVLSIPLLPTNPSGNLALDVQDNMVTNTGTSLATGPLDADAGTKARFGIVVASSTTTTITTDVSRNTLSGNGAAGDIANPTDGSGGIALSADNGGALSATVQENLLDGNVGIGIAGIARSPASQLTLTTSLNQISNSAAAFIRDPASSTTEERAVGIAGLAEDAQLVMGLNGDLIDGGLAGAGLEDRTGVLLASAGSADLQVLVSNVEIRNWANYGSRLVTFDSSQASLTLGGGNRIHDNDAGLRIEASDLRPVSSISNIVISAGNEFNNNASLGLDMCFAGSSQATLLIDGARIFANAGIGLAVDTEDTAVLNATISNNLFGSRATGLAADINGLDATVGAIDQSTINLVFNNNLGDPPGFVFFSDPTATFNLTASGNDPTPIGP